MAKKIRDDLFGEIDKSGFRFSASGAHYCEVIIDELDGFSKEQLLVAIEAVIREHDSVERCRLDSSLSVAERFNRKLKEVNALRETRTNLADEIAERRGIDLTVTYTQEVMGEELTLTKKLRVDYAGDGQLMLYAEQTGVQ
jgi:hypothetical protein